MSHRHYGEEKAWSKGYSGIKKRQESRYIGQIYSPSMSLKPLSDVSANKSATVRCQGLQGPRGTGQGCNLNPVRVWVGAW